LGAGSGAGFLSLAGLAIKTSLFIVFVSLLAILHLSKWAAKRIRTLPAEKKRVAL
jgi:hypothetical protein